MRITFKLLFICSSTYVWSALEIKYYYLLHVSLLTFLLRALLHFNYCSDSTDHTKTEGIIFSTASSTNSAASTPDSKAYSKNSLFSADLQPLLQIPQPQNQILQPFYRFCSFYYRFYSLHTIPHILIQILQRCLLSQYR